MIPCLDLRSRPVVPGELPGERRSRSERVVVRVQLMLAVDVVDYRHAGEVSESKLVNLTKPHPRFGFTLRSKTGIGSERPGVS